MDYNAWNIALAKEKQGEYVMSTLGPYDYWAIEYAYKPIAPADEKRRARAHRRAQQRAAARLRDRRGDRHRRRGRRPAR